MRSGSLWNNLGTLKVIGFSQLSQNWQAQKNTKASATWSSQVSRDKHSIPRGTTEINLSLDYLRFCPSSSSSAAVPAVATLEDFVQQKKRGVKNKNVRYR